MVRVRKHVHDRGPADPIATPNEPDQVARVCARLAGDVDDPIWAQAQDLGQRRRLAARPGRIQDGCVVPPDPHLPQHLLHQPRHVLDPRRVDASVEATQLHGTRVLLDRGDRFGIPRDGDGDGSNPGV